MKCPVCDMESSSSTIRADHLGIDYHFCSEPCRENFLARPALYVGRYAPKKSGRSIIKRRTITLDEPVAGMQCEDLKVALHRLMSVDNISIECDRISIDYDLLQITASQIEEALSRAGALMGAGWGGRLKRGWIHYTEENELDNLATGDAACCNKPPAKG